MTAQQVSDLQAAPDKHYDREGDRVAGRLVGYAAHLGDFQGIPATGQHVTFEFVDIVRILQRQDRRAVDPAACRSASTGRTAGTSR